MQLLLLLVASQVIYEWTDAQGTHYTDDAAKVPKDVRAKVSGSPETPRPPAADAGQKEVALPPASPRPAPVDTCERGRAGVAAMELRVSQIETEPDPGERCTALLNSPVGDPRVRYSQCLAERERTLEVRRARLTAAKERLEAERDGLRRAQVAGCR